MRFLADESCDFAVELLRKQRSAGDTPWYTVEWKRPQRGAMKQVKIIIEKHEDGYVAYPVGIRGVVVGEGNTYEEALRDVQSALKFHVESFGAQALDGDEGPVLEAFVAEALV